ncbi:MAG: DUF421 domain-containing protein [Bacillota bacterium]|nr:DUF421 domain-containing protein [Bacillota bacterium]
MPEALLIVFKSTFAFFVLLLMTRLMGKTEVSQLSYFDYIVGITIGTIAGSMSIDPGIMMSSATTGVLVWAGLKIMMELLTLRSIPARKILEGEPIVVIKNGKLMEKAMGRTFYNTEELMVQLRNKDIFDLSEIEEAVLEPNGKISVIKKSQYQPLTPKDMHISTNYKGMPQVLVIDGKVAQHRLAELRLSEEWLNQQLNNLGIDSISQVMLAQLNTQGELFVDKKDDWERWK